MTISMYAASVPCFVSMLRNLDAILAKALDHAVAKKIDPAVLIGARLFPDMLPFVKQVQIATDRAKGAVARLAGVAVPRYEDTEQSFDELRARLAKTIEFVASFSAGQIDGSEEREIALKVGGHEMSFKGLPYLRDFALPNFYFHLVTTYNIPRHNGVEVGKSDYIGNPWQPVGLRSAARGESGLAAPLAFGVAQPPAGLPLLVPARAHQFPYFRLGVAPTVAVGQSLDQRLAFRVFLVDQLFRDLAFGQRHFGTVAQVDQTVVSEADFAGFVKSHQARSALRQGMLDDDYRRRADVKIDGWPDRGIDGFGGQNVEGGKGQTGEQQCDSFHQDS